MDTMSLVVTVTSLVVAAASLTVAWQVTRAERQRRAARVAALASAAGLTPRPALATSSATASPETQAQAPASATRVPAGLHEFMPVRHDAPAPAAAGITNQADVAALVAVGGLFGEPAAASGSAGRQQWLMGAAGVFAAIVVTFAVIGFLGSHAVITVAAPQQIPLELVALAHTRTDGTLSVAGLVRNPASGAHVQDLEAEVRVFDASGILIGTRSARVESPALEAGQEASFSVPLGPMMTAARYRVSFRAAGTMLPHVDRRTNQPAAVTADAR